MFIGSQLVSVSECVHVIMQEVNKNPKSIKVKVYSDICRHFKPVFHHFFMEKFPSPPQWFERRLSYTRSVAASSIGQWNCVCCK